MKFISSLLFIFIFTTFYSQTTDTISTIVKKDTTYWVQKKAVGLDISQIAFMNWNAGGNSSISGLLKGDFSKKYTRGNVIWNNEMSIRYGVNKQEERELRKTDDAFSILSNYGYKTKKNSNWYTTARFNFNTQFTNGYSYPDTETAISRIFAPAYVFLGVGSEYVRKDWNATFYMSPFTFKTTFVLDQRLADLGTFGVDKAIFDDQGNLVRHGRKTRTELGILLNNYWKREIYKNMTIENRISLYTDYLNNFGNIDVDWQMQLNMIVNEYVRANIGLHIIYDDDIKATEEIDGEQITVGPKLQLKQALGIGIIYTF